MLPYKPSLNNAAHLIAYTTATPTFQWNYGGNLELTEVIEFVTKPAPKKPFVIKRIDG